MILSGVIMLALGGFSFKSRERVADVGPIEVTAERERSIPVPPILAGLAIVGGVLLIVANTRRTG